MIKIYIKMFEEKQEDQIRQIIRDELQEFLSSDRYIFHKVVQFLDGRNIQVGNTTGTKIGTSATQKLGLYGVTPIVQGSAISDPSGGVTIDAQSRTAIIDILGRLRDMGIIK